MIQLDSRWFEEGDFRFRLGTIPGSEQEFFAPSPEAAAALAERRQWLRGDPDRYAALLPEGCATADEFAEIVATWPFASRMASSWSGANGPNLGPLARMIQVSECLEPDFVLLIPRVTSTLPDFTVVGGCVCFPSGWRLTDKLGLSVEQVHDAVPHLNAALGGQIDRLLAQLRPGRCVIRANWGVCRTSEFNQHPDRNLPPVPPTVPAGEAWLRREDQCLFVLPRTRGIVFGIRVIHTSWQELSRHRKAAAAVAQALRTMPSAMQDYKRLSHVSQRLAQLLEEGLPGDTRGDQP